MKKKNYAETTRNLRENQRLKRDFWRFLRRKKRGNPRKKRHFSIHGYLSTNLKKISLLLPKIVKKITIPFIWVNPGEKWGKQVT